MKYFFIEKKLIKRIKKYKKILLILDFDGTLSPIVKKPHHARLSPQFKSALLKFRHSDNVYVAIISGRSIASLKGLINLDFIYYGGNHGLEIKGPGINFLCREAKINKKNIMKIYKDVKNIFHSMPQIIIENKGFSISVHYRCLEPEYKNEFRGKISRIKNKFAALLVMWRKYRKVLEILPETSCDKGKAAQYLLNRLGYPYPIAIGDDGTDEDMFKVLHHRGIAIRVRRQNYSHARFYLKNQREVLKAIKMIYNLKHVVVSPLAP
jgi:trehalose-phosphatase